MQLMLDLSFIQKLVTFHLNIMLFMRISSLLFLLIETMIHGSPLVEKLRAERYVEDDQFPNGIPMIPEIKDHWRMDPSETSEGDAMEFPRIQMENAIQNTPRPQQQLV